MGNMHGPRSFLVISGPRLRAMVEAGKTVPQMAAELQVSDKTITRRCQDHSIVPNGQRKPDRHAFAEPTTRPAHVAAVTMPDMPLRARKDYPDLLAALDRAKGRPAPQTTLAQIATRFRIPVAMVQGLAGRVWE